MANFVRGRNRTTVLRGGVQRRQTLWLASTWTVDTVTAANTATLLTQLNAAALALRPFTIIRTRGQIQLVTDQSANTEDQEMIYGHIVVTDEAVAIGVTAIPTPVAQPASDWHVFEPRASSIRVSSAIGILVEHPSTSFDSKAMRKVDLGQDFITVWETGGASSGATIRVFQRTLIKLH